MVVRELDCVWRMRGASPIHRFINCVIYAVVSRPILSPSLPLSHPSLLLEWQRIVSEHKGD